MFIEPNPEIIRKNFGKISRTYDAANDAMTMGLLRLWRRQLIEWSGVQSGHDVLDVATGTGDLAILFKKVVGVQGHVVGLDLTPEMIEVAEKKASRRNLDVEWVIGDGMNLPFEDHSFDVTTISYGIRNIQDPVKALKEFARVTRPGGRVLILETGAPTNHLWRTLYGTYFKNIIPTIGGLVSNGHFGPYHFLQKSSMNFPSGLEFLEWMKQTEAFDALEFKSFLGGVSYLYKGEVVDIDQTLRN